MSGTSAKTEITYWEIPEERVILKRVNDTLVNQVQVKGSDLKKDFNHNWEKVTFPSKERLDEHLKSYIPSTLEAYDKMLCEYFQWNDVKRSMYNDDRQRRYEAGELKL
jgi:hypothetical protein